MLFSNDRIARSINETFEPAWQSVRDVPLVRIDFGQGNVLTRTLNGNIATYICTADGQVLDVLPGIYEPQTYQDRLAQLALLHRWLQQRDGTSPDEKLARYHRTQGEALARGDAPHVVAGSAGRARAATRLDVTKTAVVERPLKLVLKAAPAGAVANHASGLPRGYGVLAGVGALGIAVANHAGGLPGGYPEYAEPPRSPKAASATKSENPSALLESLVNDTKLNETARRGKIHERLADSGPVTPAELTKWLYRDVLDTDLDDPHLGLGETLFATYPFKAEDEKD